MLSELENTYGEATKAYKEYLDNRLQNDALYQKEYASILKAQADLEEAIAKGKQEEIEKAMEAVTNAYNKAITKSAKDDVVGDAMKKKLEKEIDEWQAIADAKVIKLKFSAENTSLKNEIQSIIDKMGGITAERLEELYKKPSEALDTQKIKISEVSDGYDELKDKVEEAFGVGLTENMQVLKEKLEENGITVEFLIDHYEELGIKFSETSEKAAETTVAVDDINKIMSGAIDGLANLESQFSTVRSAMDEFNQYGSISASTLKNLVDNNLLQYFDVLDGKLALNEAAMVNDATATKANAVQKMALKAAINIAAIAEENAEGPTKALSKTQDTAKTKAALLSNAFIALGQDAITGAAGVKKLWKAVENSGQINTSGLTEYAKSQITNVLSNFRSAVNTINSISVSAITYGRVSATSSGSSSSSAAASAAQRAAEQAKKEAEAARKAIVKAFEDAITERERLEQRFVKNKKALGLLSNEDEKYILQESIKRYKIYAEEVNKLTIATEEEKNTLRKKYLEKAEDLEVEYIKLLNDLLDDQLDEIEDRYEDSVDAYKDGVDEKIDAIKAQAQAEIDALRKVEDENERIRKKEEYEEKRKELVSGYQGVEYWRARTGREAQLALAEAEKKVAELDQDWQETVESWAVDDQILLIEQRRDADIAATEAERDAYLKALEETKNADIQALQDKYKYQIDYFNQTGEIIADNATIQSQELFDIYKTNFTDPIGTELANALSSSATTTTTTSTPAPTPSTIDYTIQWGDTLTAIARRYNTTIEKILQVNPYITDRNLIYAGRNLKIPTSHTGSKIIKDGLVELQAGETVLNMEWAKGLDKMLNEFNKNSLPNNTINKGNTINVTGSLIDFDANIEDKTDAVYLSKRLTRELSQKFNIK